MAPLPKSTRYAVKKTKGGKKIRLAFSPKGEVIEAKNMMTKAKLSKKNKKMMS